ncbi:MAG: hypothetical protein JXB46_06900, partial [Candidatus Eisenbacteria bacterium]|nr:hypothetical protein [Candidatus Eisenbacteria bacterium]
MRRLTRATIALPLAVVLAGILIPLLLGQGDRSVAPGTEGVPLEIKGRTAVQWATAAQEAAERSEFNLALRCIKTAEQADPGTQYAESLTAIRRARWRYQEALELQDRLLHGPLESAAFGDDGSLLVGYRTVVALPGESLWSLARALVAAERGILGDEVPQRDPDVYGHWDRLVELNGLRELEVGERVAFPLSDQDVVSIEASNRADLGRIADASVALDSGDVAEAEILLDGVTGSFARGTDAFRETRDAIDLARELSLVEGARETIEALAT